MRGTRLSGWRSPLAWLVVVSVCLFANADPVAAPASAYAPVRPVLQLDSQTSKTDLSPYVSYYHDVAGVDHPSPPRGGL